MIHIIREDPETGHLHLFSECDAGPWESQGEPLHLLTAEDWWFLRNAEADLAADYDLCSRCGILSVERRRAF